MSTIDWDLLTYLAKQVMANEIGFLEPNEIDITECWFTNPITIDNQTWRNRQLLHNATEITDGRSTHQGYAISFWFTTEPSFSTIAISNALQTTQFDIMGIWNRYIEDTSVRGAHHSKFFLKLFLE
eukprot:832178_1